MGYKKLNILATIPETYADGPGIRYAIYVAGCTHCCDGCHNEDSWSFDQGISYIDKMDQIIKEIRSNPMLTGITISGGDPMENPIDLYTMLAILKIEFPEKDIWVYTGYEVEELIAKGEDFTNCFRFIDTLVDGKYMKDLREDTNFRGSSNQRFVKTKDLLISSSVFQ